MELSICSYSFHRLLAAGKQDIFRYITDCKDLGCTYLDPWNAHFAGVQERDSVKQGWADPTTARLPAADAAYLDQVKAAADAVGLPFGCIAVDGGHIYEPTPEGRAANRVYAYRWLEIAGRLGAKQVRIDAGGPPEMPDDAFALIVEGYGDLIARGRDKGIEIVIENHWGPSNNPDNLLRILQAADGLGLLFDTYNWAKGLQERGWQLCARYACATHIKTFTFDVAGNEVNEDIPRVMRLLVETGYRGIWGIESCPEDGDEYAGVRRTIALMRRVLTELGVEAVN